MKYLQAPAQSCFAIPVLYGSLLLWVAFLVLVLRIEDGPQNSAVDGSSVLTFLTPSDPAQKRPPILSAAHLTTKITAGKLLLALHPPRD